MEWRRIADALHVAIEDALRQRGVKLVPDVILGSIQTKLGYASFKAEVFSVCFRRHLAGK
jgi:hypothetical protein